MNPMRHLLCMVSFTAAITVYAQSPAPISSRNVVPAETEPGIPVTDKITTEKCSTCHIADQNGNLTRISWMRTTPEGWEQAVKRMIRLNLVTLTPEEAHHIVAYLAEGHGLAPEEIAPQHWWLEMRNPQSEFTPNAATRVACASCHAFARPETWYRSKTEWRLLVNMHMGYFPWSRFAAFYAPPNSEMGTPDYSVPNEPNRAPVDTALDYLTDHNPLHTEAWSSWRAQAKNPDLKGRWIITASAPGKGKYFGVMEVTAGPAPGLFRTDATLTRVFDKSKLSILSQSTVYTGYEWRGSGMGESLGAVRQVMIVSPDQSKIDGRWFWGGYNEFGLDVSARRDNGDMMVLGADVTSIRAGSTGVPVRVMGAKFPKDLQAADFDLGAGTHVLKVAAVKPDGADILVDVDANAISGARSVSVKGRTVPAAFSVYDKIDYIKISEPSALAHLGSAGHPKGYVQFEAVAYNRGVDGKANTADDINLGPIAVKWSMEEFISRYNDDDAEFVGSISADGLFTPSAEGPNPQRRFNTNNTGDVWIVATYTDKAGNTEPLTARSYLAVTVPAYVKWEQPEVGK
ncbi:MAG TPA: quinohemoprotein amine dehydrogenase subunit alpha [Bryobacteraceae bacterium]|nr:quinohemoprotein amine dehydrogenase subunit alpha [Bryobacteraceae bacterium]